MLNTTEDIKTEVVVRGQANTSSGHITDGMLNDWLTEKHRWAASYKKWPFTEGRASTTYASLVTDEDGELRGEYPEGWKPDSVRWMWIGQKRIRKMRFQEYKRFREESSDAQDKVFTDYGRLYYLNPNADVSGTLTVWGQYTPIDVDVTGGTTIFSNIDEDGNEAIVEAMLGELLIRSKKTKEAEVHISKATALLEGIWKKIQEEQHGYHGGEAGMWEYIDVLAGGLEGDIRRDRWY